MKNVFPTERSVSNRFRNMALLCTCFVVIIHCEAIFGVNSLFVQWAVADGICGIAVPFFFFASGYFLSKHVNEVGWWKRAFLSRVRTLAVPYLVFCVTYWLFRNMWYVIMNMKNCRCLLGGVDVSVNALIDGIGLNPSVYPVLTPLWYIRALFVLVLISFLFVRYQKVFLSRWGLLALFFLYGFLAPWGEGGGVIQNHVVRNILRITCAVHGLFYMGVGMAFGIGKLEGIFNDKRLGFACFFFGLIVQMLKFWAQLNGAKYYPYLGWLSCPFLVFGVFSLIPNICLPAALSSCAFPVYLFHMFVISSVSRVMSLCGHRFALPTLYFSCSAMGCVFLSFLIVLFQRKYFPKANNFLYGGR